MEKLDLELNDKIQKLVKKYQDIIAENKQLKNQNREILDKSNQYLEKIANLQNNEEVLRSDIHDYKIRLEKLATDNNDLQEKVNNFERNKEEAVNKIDNILNQIDAL